MTVPSLLSLTIEMKCGLNPQTLSVLKGYALHLRNAGYHF